MSYIQWFSLTFSVLFFGLLFLMVWLRWRMRVSKARFALTVISTIASCLFAALSVVATSLPVLLITKISQLFKLEPVDNTFTNITSNLVILFLTVIAIRSIYKFSSNAIASWEAPARISDIELSESNLENDLLALAQTELILLTKWKTDPIASDFVFNWQKNITPPPGPVEEKDLLRDLLQACFREISIPENGWRDEGKFWVGEKYGVSGNDSSPIVAIVFSRRPDLEDMRKRMQKIAEFSSRGDNVKYYALYISNSMDSDRKAEFNISGNIYTVLSSRFLIHQSIDLYGYARKILDSFHNTKVGGTNATLANSFVELNVTSLNKKRESRYISEILDSWSIEESNRHLVILGEYGQGKSTALLQFCCEWAQRFLSGDEITEKIPLLIELRGKNPAENDRLDFISTWCSRYQLLPNQVLNLIKSGDAILVFEGFDELRNAGRAFDRHQHFNSLWQFAYPGSKLLFTGRPNFFLDDLEANRTLRQDSDRGASGAAYTEAWHLDKLSKVQIVQACRAYGSEVRDGIVKAATTNSDFFEIACRPSMLPVIATIWSEIDELNQQGIPLTGSILIEKYIRSIFARKEAELERDRVVHDAPSGSRYLVLPRPMRELLTICVAWRMAAVGAKNTIARHEISNMVSDLYETLITFAKSDGALTPLADAILEFEARFSESTQLERIEIIATEICSAGLLIQDPAGGSSNLSFPHKQFYEYLISKAFLIMRNSDKSFSTKLLNISANNKNPYRIISNEFNSIKYLSQSYGTNTTYIFDNFTRIVLKYTLDTTYYFRFVGRMFANSNSEEPPRENIADENVIQAGLMTRLSLSRFPYFLAGFIITTFLFLALSTTILFFNIDRNPASQIDSFLLAAALITIGTGASIIILSSIFSNMMFYLTVLQIFVYSHWENDNPTRFTTEDSLRLLSKSLAGGVVKFPGKGYESDTDLEQFLYPSREFGL